MSFILDALRKSESERQQQQAAEFATVPSGATATAAPRWLWLVGSLLVLNLVVLAVFLFRGGADGMRFVRPILEQVGGLLAPGGRALVEVAASRAEEARGVAEGAGLAGVQVFKDIDGLARVVVAERR